MDSTISYGGPRRGPPPMNSLNSGGPPACVQNAMMTKDKKPFTYTPGGIDLSEIKSPRMAKRIARNAQYEGVTGQPKPSPLAQPNATTQHSPGSGLPASAMGTPVQVFPTGPPPPPPPPAAPKNQLAPQANGTAPRKSPTPQNFEPPPMGCRPEIKIPPNPMASLRKVPKPQPKDTFWIEEYRKERSKSPMVTQDGQGGDDYQENDSSNLPNSNYSDYNSQPNSISNQQNSCSNQLQNNVQTQQPQYRPLSPPVRQQPPVNHQPPAPQWQPASGGSQQQHQRAKSPVRTEFQTRIESPFTTVDNPNLQRPLSPIKMNHQQQQQHIFNQQAQNSPYAQSQQHQTAQVPRPNPATPQPQLQSPTQPQLQSPPQQTKQKHAQVGSLYIPRVAPENLAINKQQGYQQQQPQQQSHPIQQEINQPRQPATNLQTPPWLQQKPNQKEIPEWVREDTARPQQQRTQTPPISANNQYHQPQQDQQQSPGFNFQINAQPAQNAKERIIPIQLEQSPNTPKTPSFGAQPYYPQNQQYGGVSSPGSAGNTTPQSGYSSPVVRNPNQFVDQGYNNYPQSGSAQPQTQQQQQQQQPQQYQHAPWRNPNRIQESPQPQQPSGTRIIPISVEGQDSSPFSPQSVRGPVMQSPTVIQNDPRTLQHQLSWGNGGPNQSKSFRVLQKITDTESDGQSKDDQLAELQRPYYGRQMGGSVDGTTDQMKRMQMNDQDQSYMNRARNQVPMQRQQPPRYVQQRPIYQQEDQHQPYIHPSEQQVPEPKKYTGSAIPSRSFKILQAMTTPENAAEMEGSGVPYDRYSPYPVPHPHHPPPPHRYGYPPYFHPNDPNWHYYYPPPPPYYYYPYPEYDSRMYAEYGYGYPNQDTDYDGDINSNENSVCRDTPSIIIGVEAIEASEDAVQMASVDVENSRNYETEPEEDVMEDENLVKEPEETLTNGIAEQGPTAEGEFEQQEKEINEEAFEFVNGDDYYPPNSVLEMLSKKLYELAGPDFGLETVDDQRKEDKDLDNISDRNLPRDEVEIKCKTDTNEQESEIEEEMDEEEEVESSSESNFEPNERSKMRSSTDGLQAIKSVTNIKIYDTDDDRNDKMLKGETSDDDTSESESESTSSAGMSKNRKANSFGMDADEEMNSDEEAEELTEDEMAIQESLSVIYEESEIDAQSKQRPESRASTLSDCSTTIANDYNDESEVATDEEKVESIAEEVSSAKGSAASEIKKQDEADYKQLNSDDDPDSDDSTVEGNDAIAKENLTGDEKQPKDGDENALSLVTVRLPLKLSFSKSENNENITTVVVGDSEIEDDKSISIDAEELDKDDEEHDVSVSFSITSRSSSIDQSGILSKTPSADHATTTKDNDDSDSEVSVCISLPMKRDKFMDSTLKGDVTNDISGVVKPCEDAFESSDEEFEEISKNDEETLVGVSEEGTVLVKEDEKVIKDEDKKHVENNDDETESEYESDEAESYQHEIEKVTTDNKVVVPIEESSSDSDEETEDESENEKGVEEPKEDEIVDIWADHTETRYAETRKTIQESEEKKVEEETETESGEESEEEENEGDESEGEEEEEKEVEIEENCENKEIQFVTKDKQEPEGFIWETPNWDKNGGDPEERNDKLEENVQENADCQDEYRKNDDSTHLEVPEMKPPENDVLPTEENENVYINDTSFADDLATIQEKFSEIFSTFNSHFDDEFKLSVRDRIAAIENPQSCSPDSNKLEVPKVDIGDDVAIESVADRKKALSRNSSLQKSESEIEEDDSGVTSDMSKPISETDTESECFPELRKMTRYQRAATHSRLFKLLQDECSTDDNRASSVAPPEKPKEEIEFVSRPRKKIVHNVSITRRQNPDAIKDAETMSQRRERLSLPLKSNSIDADNLSSSNSPSSPATNSNSTTSRSNLISDKLVNELVQSLLLKKKSCYLRDLPMEKLQAAAKKVLEEHFDSLEDNSLDSTPALTPQEFKTEYPHSYADYYETWNTQEAGNIRPGFDILPSRAFKNLQEQSISGQKKLWAARCPRVLSSKTINRDLARVTEARESESPETLRSPSRIGVSATPEKSIDYKRGTSVPNLGKV